MEDDAEERKNKTWWWYQWENCWKKLDGRHQAPSNASISENSQPVPEDNVEKRIIGSRDPKNDQEASPGAAPEKPPETRSRRNLRYNLRNRSWLRSQDVWFETCIRADGCEVAPFAKVRYTSGGELTVLPVLHINGKKVSS